MTEKEATAAELLVAESDLATAEVVAGAMMSAEELDDDTPPSVKKHRLKRIEGVEEEPSMCEPEWSEFVMQQFTDDERDIDGRPLVTGLRRVTRLLLGPILESGPEPIQCPRFVPGMEGQGRMEPTVMLYRVKILMCRLEEGQVEPYEIKFSEVADVSHINTDPDFARFASATAATRAEARCLRKALQLTGIAAEEKTLVPTPTTQDGMIDEDQIQFINLMCRRNDINVLTYINAGKAKYQKIEDVPFSKAAEMAEHLSGLQQQRSKIKPEWKGYDKNWRK